MLLVIRVGTNTKNDECALTCHLHTRSYRLGPALELDSLVPASCGVVIFCTTNSALVRTAFLTSGAHNTI